MHICSPTSKMKCFQNKPSLTQSGEGRKHNAAWMWYFNLPLPPPSSASPCYIDVRTPVVSLALPGMTNCYLAPTTLLSFILLRYAANWLHSTTAWGDNNLHWSDPSAYPAVTNGNRLLCGSTIDCPTHACVCGTRCLYWWLLKIYLLLSHITSTQWWNEILYLRYVYWVVVRVLRYKCLTLHLMFF